MSNKTEHTPTTILPCCACFIANRADSHNNTLIILWGTVHGDGVLSGTVTSVIIDTTCPKQINSQKKECISSCVLQGVKECQ